jgi:hypothetical protein
MARLTAKPTTEVERQEDAQITDEDVEANKRFARRYLSVITQAMLAAKEA